MKMQVDIYKDGQIVKTISVKGFDKAVSFALQLLFIELRRRVFGDGGRNELHTNYLDSRQWAGKITVDDAAAGPWIYGITVRKEK